MAKKAHIRVLGHHEVDSLVRSSKVFAKSGWHSGSQLEIDLSRVEYVEYGATARLLAFVEGAVRNSCHVSLAMPDTTIRRSEADFVEQQLNEMQRAKEPRPVELLKQRIESRRRARTFLTAIGFDSCVQLPHLDESSRRRVRFFEQGEPIKFGASGSLERADATIRGGRSYRRYPAILQLSWIANAKGFEAWAKEVSKYLYRTDMVTTTTDGQSIVYAVFRQLVENVLDHASDASDEAPGALVGAITYNRSRIAYKPDPQHFSKSMGPYVDWIGQTNQPIGRLVVCDSGLGMVSTLGERFEERQGSKAKASSTFANNVECVQYAYEAAASKKRGTGFGEGLSAVRGFAQSYHGLVSLRSDNVDAGFSYEVGIESRFGGGPFAYTPGVSAELFIGLTLRSRERQERASSVSEAETEVRLLRIDEGEEAKDLRHEIEAALAGASGHTILVLQVGHWPTTTQTLRDLVATVRRLASGLTGRAGLAVMCESTTGAGAASAFGPVDEGEEQQSSPFLVVAADHTSFWSGGSAIIRKALTQISKAGRTSFDDDLVLGGSDQDRDYFRTERHWLVADMNGYRLRHSVDDIDRAVIDQVRTSLSRLVGAEDV